MSSQISWFYTSDGGGSSGLINTGLPRYSSVLNGDSLQLVIEDPTPADNGVYTVRVYHSAGNVSQDVTLRVLSEWLYTVLRHKVRLSTLDITCKLVTKYTTVV